MLVGIELVEQTDRGGLSLAGFDGPALRVACITSIPISLATLQSDGHCHLRRKLGNVMQLCAWEEEEMGLLGR